MATELELRIKHEEALLDVLRLMEARSEKEMRRIAREMQARVQSGMTVEQIAAVKERLAVMMEE